MKYGAIGWFLGLRLCPRVPATDAPAARGETLIANAVRFYMETMMTRHLLFAATLLLGGTCWAQNPNDRLTFRFLVDSPLTRLWPSEIGVLVDWARAGWYGAGIGNV